MINASQQPPKRQPLTAPSPDQIAAACQRIQSEWTLQERRARTKHRIDEASSQAAAQLKFIQMLIAVHQK